MLAKNEGVEGKKNKKNSDMSHNVPTSHSECNHYLIQPCTNKNFKN